MKVKAYLTSLRVDTEIEVVANSINPKKFNKHNSDYLHKRLSLEPNSKILLWVGRLEKEKNPVFIYQTFIRTVKKIPANIHLVYVGIGTLDTQIRRMMIKDKLKGRVHFLGMVPNELMPEVYNSATLWLSASLTEVQPMWAIEAVCCGLPGLVIKDSAWDEIIVDKKNGYVAQNERQFGQLLSKFLADDEAIRNMSLNSVSLSSKFFGKETAEKMLQVYNKVLGNKKNHFLDFFSRTTK